MRKKQKRIRRDAATKAAVVARAQSVGVTIAAQEFGVASGMVSQWVRKAGVVAPKFKYIPKTGERRRLSGPEDPPGLGSGNPEPRQVTVTPPGETKSRAVRTERNVAIALAVIEGGHPAAVAETFGVTAGHVYLIRQKLAPQVARERGLEYAPPPKSARSKAPKTATMMSRRPAEQLGMYEQPASEPPLRVNAHPVRDEAELAREQSQNEMLQTALRQALRERDAFKLVHEVTMREKENGSR